MCIKGLFHFFLLLLFFGHSLQSLANYLGADVQTFTPTGDQLDLITVQSGHSLKKGWWSFGLYGSYSQNNLLIYSLPITDQIKQKPNDSLVGGQIDLAYGLTPHFEWGISLPLYLNQTISNDLYRRLYIQRGVVGIRNHIKYSVADAKSNDSAAFIFSLDMPNVANDPYIGKIVRPIFVFEIAYDIKTPQSIFAVNGGYKIRQPSEPIDRTTMWPLRDELLYSLGWAHRFSDQSALSYVLELDGSSPIGNSDYNNTSEISTLEGIIGLKGLMKSFSTWNIGAGFKLLSASMSPDWRFFLGYSWSWPNSVAKKEDILLEKTNSFDSPVKMNDKWREQMRQVGDDDSDRDGIPDDRDECPVTPLGLPVDSFGCPFDSDSDGVYDYEDSCPQSPKGDIVDRRGCTVKY